MCEVTSLDSCENGKHTAIFPSSLWSNMFPVVAVDPNQKFVGVASSHEGISNIFDDKKRFDSIASPHEGISNIFDDKKRFDSIAHKRHPFQ